MDRRIDLLGHNASPESNVMANCMNRLERRTATSLFGAALAVLTLTSLATAGPVGEQVESGNATFTRNGPNTIIDVSTQNAIINYDSFNIAAEEYVRFNQLNAQARVLNRINSAAPTVINGSLSANGQVYFVNPSGVRFGPNAIVDVAGIYAAAGSMSNADFLNNVNRFTSLTGEVVNQGTINAQFAALVGKRVVNDGIILAPEGFVTMVAGDEVLIGEKDGNIMVKVDGTTTKNDNGDIQAVANNGTIEAKSTTLAAGDMYWLGVKQSDTGAIKADTVLVDATGSKADVTGEIDAATELKIMADEVAFYSVGIGAGDVTITGQTVTVGNIAGAGSVLVLGTGGDDLHILDFNLGQALPDGGLAFDAGSQDNPRPLGDYVSVRGGSFDHMGLTFTGFDADGYNFTMTFDGTAVDFAGYEPADTDTAAAVFDIILNDIADNVSLTNGGAFGGVAESLMLNDIGGTFETFKFGNKTTVRIFGNAGAPSAGDTFLLNAANAADGLTTLIINGSDGFADNYTLTVAPAGVTTTFAAGTGADTLTGPNAVTAWNVTGADAGTVGTTNFSGMANLVGGTNVDTFTVGNAGSWGGTITGSGGNDILVGNDNDNTFVVTGGANQGTFDAQAFNNIETLQGGAGDDTFDIRDGSSIAAIDGQTNTGTGDTLTYATHTGPISINLETNTGTGIGAAGLAGVENVVGSANAGDSVTGPNAGGTFNITAAGTFDVGGINFSAIENIQGGGGVDTFSIGGAGAVMTNLLGGGSDDQFTMAGGTATLIDGEGGTGDELVGQNIANTFNITGADQGDLNGQAFQNIEDLTGGSNTDNFEFAAGASITGTIDGGIAGTDTIDYDTDSFGAPVTINLQTPSATGVGSFTNIDAFVGDAGLANAITGANANQTWTINGADSGSVGGVGFTNFPTITGGSMADVFDVTAAGSVSTLLSGGGGTDELQVDGGADDTIGVDLTNDQITGLPGGTLAYTAIETISVDGVNGGGDNDTVNVTLSALDDTIVYTPTGATGGGFTGIGTNAGQSVGTVNITNTEVLTIDAVSGTDSLAVAAGGSAVVFSNPGTPTIAPGVALPLAYSNFDTGSITGAIASLTVNHPAGGANSTLDVTGATAGTITPFGAMAFDFTNLTGDVTVTGDAGTADRFTFNRGVDAMFTNGRVINFNAGGDAGDTLILTGGGGGNAVDIQTVTMTTGSVGDGSIALIEGADTNTINFTGLAPIEDALAAVGVVVTLTTGDDTVLVKVGDNTGAGTFAGLDSLEIEGATFEDYEFANKGAVDIALEDGADTVNVDFATRATGLLALNIFGDDAANTNADVDTFNVIEVASGLNQFFLSGEDGDDVFNIGATDTLLSQIGTDVDINAGDGTGDAVNIFDDAGAAKTFTFTNNAVTDGTLTVDFGGNTAEAVTVNGGDNGNTFDVQGVVTGVTINTGTGTNTINVSSDAPANTGNLVGIAGVLSLNGEGTDTLNVSTAGGAATTTGFIDDDEIDDTVDAGFLGTGGEIGLTSIETIQIDLSGNDDTFTITDTPATTTALTVNGNNGADTVNVEAIDAATTVTLNGLAGDDIINVTPVGMDLSTIAGTLNVVGGGDTDTLNIDDSGRDSGVVYDINNTTTNEITATGMGNPITVDNTLEALTLEGSTDGDAADGDTFDIIPSVDYTITIAGNDPTSAPGDQLNVDISGFANPGQFKYGQLSNPGSGVISSPTNEFEDVAFSEIEDFVPTGPLDLLLDMGFVITGTDGLGNGTPDAANIMVNAAGTHLAPTVSPNGGGAVGLIEIPLTSANSLTVIGSTDDETVSITETAGGLPAFLASAPTGHTNTAFTASGLAPANVGMHFDGATGTDTLAVTLITAVDAAYFSDTVGAANSGVVNLAGAMTTSFENLAPVNVVGAGGTYTVDASANPNMAGDTITLTDNGTVAPFDTDGINTISSTEATFETTNFSGFANLVLRGGNGAQTINVVNVDNDDDFGFIQQLVNITVTGDNTTGTDVSNDTINISSLANPGAPLLPINVTAQGGGGDDTINVGTNPVAPNTNNNNLSEIDGAIIVDGGTGTDTLVVNDSANVSVNNGTISDTTITGFGLPVTGIAYSNFADLDLFTGDGVDTIAIDDSLFTRSIDITTAAGDDIINVNDLGVTRGGGTSIVLTTGADNDQVNINLETISAGSSFNANILVDMGTEAGGVDELDIEGTTAANETFVFRRPAAQDELQMDQGGGNEHVIGYTDVELFQLDTNTGDDVVQIDNPVGGAGTSNTDLVTLNIIATGGDVVDNNATDPDITATNLNIQVADGIGSAGTLETAITNLAFVNTTSGQVNITNTGALTINDGTTGTEGDFSAITRGNLGGGDSTIVAASPLTVVNDTNFNGNTVLTASDDGAADTDNDDLTIDGATVLVDGNGLTLNLNAGDDVRFINGGNVNSAGAGNHTVTIVADSEGAASGDTDRGSVHQTGATTSITATNVSITSVGNDGDHTVAAGIAIGNTTATPLVVNATNLTTSTVDAGVANEGHQFLREVDGLTTTNLDAVGGVSTNSDIHLDLVAGTVDQAAGNSIQANELSLTGTGNFILDATMNDVDEIAATVTGNVTYVNMLDAGRVAVDVVDGGTTGETGVTLTGGLFDITADGVAVNENISAVGVNITGRDDDAVATDADTLVNVAAGHSINANAGDLNVVAENLTIDPTASLSGSGAATFAPTADSDAITLGNTNDDVTVDTLEIDDAEIATLAEGFTGITIGRATGAHTINVLTTAFLDNITIQTPGGGVINVNSSGDAVAGIDTTTSADAASITLLADGNAAAASVVMQIDDDLFTTDAPISLLIDGGAVPNAVVAGFGTDGGTVTIDTTANGGSGANIVIEADMAGFGADFGPIETLFATAGTGSVNDPANYDRTAPPTINPNILGSNQFALQPIFSGAPRGDPRGQLRRQPGLHGRFVHLPGSGQLHRGCAPHGLGQRHAGSQLRPPAADHRSEHRHREQHRPDGSAHHAGQHRCVRWRHQRRLLVDHHRPLRQLGHHAHQHVQQRHAGRL
jgi:filamentous hemagglutinin family protein